MGRPWQKEPRTVFIRCEEPAALNPAGWSTWNVTPALYAEYRCTGPGSDTGSRISISRQLTDEQAQKYTLKTIFSAESNPRYAFDWMPENIVLTAVNNGKSSDPVPLDYRLKQNYPNPFNPATTVAFSIPKSGRVQITLYNLLGEQMMMLMDEKLSAGQYEVEIHAGHLPSGIYVYCLQSGRTSIRKKMCLLK